MKVHKEGLVIGICAGVVLFTIIWLLCEILAFVSKSNANKPTTLQQVTFTCDRRLSTDYEYHTKMRYRCNNQDCYDFAKDAYVGNCVRMELEKK